MIELSLLDDEYREAFLYLVDEINTVMSCSDNKEPWFPNDVEKLEEVLRVYRRWHLDPDKNGILNFPWPKHGRIPKVSADYLKPTDEEKKKVRDFIAKNEGLEMDPLTEMIVQLGKDLIQEVH
jgi:hypothetical protein